MVLRIRSWLMLLCVLAWVGCGGPLPQNNNNAQIEPVLEIIPEPGVSADHQSPIPHGTKVPKEVDRPDDKPDDPSLFVGSIGPWIGDPCTKSSDCNFDDGYCMTANDGFPSGYCLKGCSKYCPDRSGKPFTFCVKRGSGGVCFSRCDTNKYPGTGCRPGYKCQTESRYNQSSMKRDICVPDANGPSQPPPPPPNTSRWIGEPCSRDSDCDFAGGYCSKESDGFPQGYCMKACTQFCPDQAGKPETFCIAHGSGGVCTSRCDTSLYPGTGCRAGYTCEVKARYNQASVTQGVCVPPSSSNPSPPPPPPPPPATGDLPITSGISCYDQLTRWGVKYTRTSDPNTLLSGASRRCSISQPVRLQPPVLGVDYVIWTNQRITMLTSCQLAMSIARLSHYLKQQGINKVMHLGTYNCRKISGSSKLSNHSFGSAIDLGAFYGTDGTEYNLVKSWDHSTTWTQNGRMGCWSTRFNSLKAKMLYDIACDMWKKRIFTLILTPNYNRDHDNHFHVDFSSSGKVLSTENLGYIGTTGDEGH